MLFSDRKTVLALSAVIAVSFFVSRFFLFQSPLLQGQDAAYYLLGVESIQRTGFLPSNVLEYPPVFFYTAALFSFFSDAVAGIKIAAALFSALLAFSVFLLARQLFKSNEAALASALLVFLAPVSMRLLNGFWKTSAALFFLPLFFYFFLRAGNGKESCKFAFFRGLFRKNKNLLLAFVVLLLVFLSHKFVALLALLILLVFVLFQFVFEKRVSGEAKNAAIIFIVFSLFFSAAFFASGKDVSDLLGLFGLINAMESSSASASLWQYFSALTIPAFFGALYCFFNAKKEQLFLLCWFVLGLFVAMPLSSGSNYWRFAFLLAVPFSLLAGFFFLELKKRLGVFNSLIVFIIIVALTLPQFYSAAIQIQPIYNEKELAAIRGLKEFSPSAVLFSKGSLLQWLQYFDANAFNAGENVLLEAKQASESGKKAFVAVDEQRKMLDYSNSQQQVLDNNFKIAFETERFALLKPLAGFQMPAPNSFAQDFSKQLRFSNPVLWLFFPAELFNLLQSPFNSFLRALLGLPLSFALIAFILFWLKKKQDSKNFRFAAFVFVAFLIFLIAVAK